MNSGNLPRFFADAVMMRAPVRRLVQSDTTPDQPILRWPETGGHEGLIAEAHPDSQHLYQAVFAILGRREFLALGLGTGRQHEPLILLAVTATLDKDTGLIQCRQRPGGTPWLHPAAAATLPAARLAELADELRATAFEGLEETLRLIHRIRVFLGLATPPSGGTDTVEDALDPVLFVLDTERTALVRTWHDIDRQANENRLLTAPMRHLLGTAADAATGWIATAGDDPANRISRLLANGTADVTVRAGAGCGKTTTGARLVQAALEQDKRVLVCASTPGALAVFLERLHPDLRPWAITLPHPGTAGASHELKVNLHRLLETAAPDEPEPEPLPPLARWLRQVLNVNTVAKLHPILAELVGARLSRWILQRLWVQARRTEPLPALGTSDQLTPFRRNAGLSNTSAYRLRRRLQDTGRPHLVAWAKAIERVGQGKGRHAALHRADAQTHLEASLPQLPLVLATPDALLQSLGAFRPAFDLLIIDEATQFGTELACLFNLAERTVMIGDDAQLATPQIGVSRTPEQLLRRVLLHEHPFADVLTAASSLFDLAEITAQGHSVLREHYRCHPHILAFSNATSYRDFPLKTARAEEHAPLGQPLERVALSADNGAGRPGPAEEADAIAQRVFDLVHDTAYQDRSIAVISLRGPAQVERIESRLLRRLPHEVWRRHQIKVGLAYHFQGSEVDVALLSLALPAHGPIRAMTREDDRRRLNVAMTRARHKVIVFTTVQAADLRPGCVQRDLLEFLEHSTAQPEHAKLAISRSKPRHGHSATEPEGHRLLTPRPVTISSTRASAFPANAATLRESNTRPELSA